MAKKKITIDFRTKILPANTRIWVIFPGEGYRFYQPMRDGDVVFADFPALRLDKFDRNNDREFLNWLSLSQKVRAFYNEKQDASKRPSLNPNDYGRYTWTGSRINAKGVVAGLYGRAQKGDLVLMTSRGGPWGTTQVGEFVDAPNKIYYQNVARYQEDPIPARPVKWVGEIDNIRFPEEVVRQLTSPNAFTQLANSYHDKVFSSVYENYFRADYANSMFDIKGEDFSTVADMYLKLIANFASSISRGIEDDNLKEVLELDLAKWLTSLEEDEHVAIQKIAINSPGINLMRSVKITPILAAVLFTLCQYSPAEIRAAEVKFVNSAIQGGQLDECDIPVAEAAKLSAALMSLDKLELLCNAAQKAKAMANIETPIQSRIEE